MTKLRQDTTHEEGLYRSEFEHDSCGIGFVANLDNSKSHDVISDALLMLENMEHRGGRGAEPETGDGAGILIQVPHEFLKAECALLGFELPEYGKYGVGMAFFHRNEGVKEATKERLEMLIEELDFELLGYREVPTNNMGIGETAVGTELPCEQVFVKPKKEISPEELERKLFVLRKYSTHNIGRRATAVTGNNYEFYWLSLSYKTIVYKGQLRTDQVKSYYPDLLDNRVVSALALVHSRFSTNTFPKWKLAQPFRYIAHNGEINTIRGNLNWMKSKEALFKTDMFTEDEMNKLLPICDKEHSDSSNLDTMIEILTLCGRSLPHVLMMMIPEAWQEHEDMEPNKRAFYEYHASMMEPWDGPASICFTDGIIVGAMLDRNGLRPSRYCITNTNKVVMSSEVGALPVDESIIVKKGRLQPGKIFVADLEKGRIVSDEEVKAGICSSQMYPQWLKEQKVTLDKLPEATASPYPKMDEDTLFNRQLVFGYSQEDLRKILGPMGKDAKEPLGSMGMDIPLPALSDQSQHLSNYFKQLFAQVSNPPIDPIRERLIMSLRSKLGKTLNLLEETPEHCHRIGLKQPILTNAETEKIRSISYKDWRSYELDVTFPATGEKGALEARIDEINKEAEKAVREGCVILILSDRKVNADRAPIPSLLISAAVHHHLINQRLRADASLLVEAGDVRETHHYATLLGYGANAINPYLAFETIEYLLKNKLMENGITLEQAQQNYIKAVGNGLLKIFSKMGISTLQSYHGAQIFEILGIGDKVVNKCFTDSISRIDGISFDDIASEALSNFHKGFPPASIPNQTLDTGGVYQWKKEGEQHLFNPETIHLLQKAVRKNDYKTYRKYAHKINDQTRKASTLRGLFEFKKMRKSIPVEEVESKENIFKRFATGAMSFGSISHEAHSTLAIAMNRIGGKSNSGEGGEDPIRFNKKENGDWERSAIKQVASGRFGVTSYYLTNADEIQIKMAQGAKPGEGGQLPGHKVDDWIGRVRHSTPGVGLISPPPHHDIYSIEDLAQLIHDLKRANRQARINVKLVSEAGVGTIASGVAKAKADVIMISGHDGGTGASPLSSIRHAGIPWEMGLAEAHQTLVRNKLRSRVTLQTDGQIKTGRDLAIAALLGAEEYGVATTALVAEGCIMMRKCHLNTCPVGIATQNPNLRKLFSGNPDDVVNLFTFLAEEMREIMAELGFRTVNEMIGQVDSLRLRDNIDHWKIKKLNLGQILFKEPLSNYTGVYRQMEQDHELEKALDWKLLAVSKPALKHLKPIYTETNIRNTDRTTGALLSNEISKIYKGEGLPEDLIHIKLLGSAGQSFGAFSTKGLKLELEGEANDYFGKGLSGAKLIVYPNRHSSITPEDNMIIGNVAFYGATNGEAYINGMAGERFAVRNSGVKAVVEGVGDHGCEYMTGGTVAILGETGRNFAAGMSGGVAYVYNANNSFEANCNPELVDLDPLELEDFNLLRNMIEKHQAYTNSQLAKRLLDDWVAAKTYFVKVMPRDYKRVLASRKSALELSEK